MAKTRRHEIEGAVLDVPLRYDQRTGRELEEYPDLQAHPVYTPAGERVMLTVEDACPHADLQPGVCQDCGACRLYRQIDGTFLGVCHSPAMRRMGR